MIRHRIWFVLLALLCTVTADAAQAVSPNGRIAMSLADGTYVVTCQGKRVLEIPQMGYGVAGLVPVGDAPRRIDADYTMVAGKRLHPTNAANEYRVTLSAGVTLVVRMYNDGLAFRYELSDLTGAALPRELTAFRIPEGTRRWMQQWADSYEGFFPLSVTARVKPVPSYSPATESADGFNRRWGYPALVEPADGLFALITEANIERLQSASCLYNDGELFSVVPDTNDATPVGTWHSPWRIVIIGSLADIVASTLVTDVSNPSQISDVSWIHPGVVSWIYWAYNHGSNDYSIIKRYVDLAVALRFPYVLIDAEWDQMRDGFTIEDAVKYANDHNVSPLIWYNSSVGWVDGAPTPKYRLNKPEDREKEFAWCERIGVAGVKIDFFSGDNRMNMEYCLDLLESAARHHLLINFHGATIPRGWQRTWPNLLPTEGVYGAEWYNNVPTFTNKAACHNATLPFTRNVVGPMDYTPCAFSNSQHPHITTNAHELALTVLYESGLQHLADRPESLLAQPDEVKAFFTALPTVWDDTRLLSGYPGDHAVLARRSGNTWYVAGINGTDSVKTITPNLSTIGLDGCQATVFADGDTDNNGWRIANAERLSAQPVVTCQPRGGFVWVIKGK